MNKIVVKNRSQFVLGLVGVLIVFLGIIFVTYQNIKRLEENANITRHTVEVLVTLENILSSLSDAETGQRGYLLTGELKYLEPYNSGVFLVNEEIIKVKKLTEDNPSQQERITSLEVLVAQKKAELQETVELRADDKGDEAIAIVLSDKGKDIMDNIRAVISDMGNEEKALLEVRTLAAVGAEESTRTIILFGTIAGLLGAIYISLLISRDVGQSVEKLRHVTSEIAKGNMNIDIDVTGNNELAQLATSVHLMRENLKKYIKSLAHKSEQLEIQLRTTEEAKAELKNLQEEQSQLLNEIAHSLQTPLTIAENQLDLLKRTASDDSRLSLISTSVGKISKFVYEILHLAKLESLSNSIQKEPVDLSHLLQEQVEYFELLAEEKGIQVISTIAPHLVIDGNKEMLGELIINLISNAEKYMSEGGERKIFISLSDKHGDTVLEVRDTGMGISNRDLPAIFRKFYRVKHAAIKGTGLGLPICKKIVERHNGSIHVKSELRKGTTFTVVFPRESSNQEGELGTH